MLLLFFCDFQEGPLIHIGTIIGGLIPSMNIPNRKISSYMNYFQNDKERRDFSAGGAAAGVAAAFGAPIGINLYSPISICHTFSNLSP